MRPVSRLLVLTLVLGLVLATALHAQHADLTFEHITVDDGLPENSVRAIVQDYLGFLWFGTQNGLVKYDGYHFTTYPHDPDDSLSLSPAEIYTLHEGRDGVIWVGMPGYLDRFDRETETFTHFRHDPNDPNSISGDWVMFMHEDRAGMLWVFSRDANGQYLDRLNPETGMVTRLRPDPDDPGSLQQGRIVDYGLTTAFLAFCEDQAGVIWIGLQGEGGLNRFDPQTETFAHFLHDPNDPASISSSGINDVYEDRAGNLWVATYDGLNLMDRATGTFTVYRHDPNDPDHVDLDRTQFIQETREGDLWIGTRNGLSRFDKETKTFTRYTHDPADPDHPGNVLNPLPIQEDQHGDFWFKNRGSSYLSRYNRATDRLTYYRPDPNDPGSISIGTRIEEMLVDRSGVLWIGTWGGGLNKLDRSSRKFPTYRHDPYDPNSLSSNAVRVLYTSPTDPNVLWIGTDEGGLNRLDRATGRFTHYRHDPNNPNSLSSDRVTAVLEDHEGMLWIGTFGGGLNRWDRTTGRFTHYRHDLDSPGSSLSSDVVWALYEDPDDELWIGGHGRLEHPGLQRFDRATERFIHHPHAQARPRDNHVYAIHEARKGGFWVATNLGGFQHFDPETERFTEYETRFSTASIVSILEDRAGRLWVGSNTLGLGHFNGNTGAHLDIPDEALAQGSILNILEDDEGYLWINTDRGLSKVDPEAGILQTYDVSDGLPSNRFSGTAHRGADGTMYFGGANGFIAFHPDQIQNNLHLPPVALTSFSLFDQPVSVGEDSPLKTSISLAESITLRHDENDFSFEFSALHYSSPEQNRYAYMLENYEDEWREVGLQRRATYMNLDPGTYTFRVKASNNDGLWNEEGASIRVIIKPPWWQTTWAYLLYGLLFLAGVVIVNRLQRRRLIRAEQEKARIRAAEERAEVLAELAELKTRFFVNVSHEFRTPLTLILGPLRDALDGAFGELGESLRPQLTLMQRNGTRLLRLINQLLDLSKLEAGSMTLHARRANLVPFLRRIVGIFASRAERRHITLQFEAKQNQIDLYFEADKLEKVFVNLLSNAFKFTPDQGTIRLSVEHVTGKAGDVAEVVVKDTGQGIAAAELPYIFDRFHQVDASTTREHEGTGIGLALVKELVVLHGGTVRVESEVGVGTTFVIRFPQGTDHLSDTELIDEGRPGEARAAVDVEIGDLETALEAVDAVLEAETEATSRENAPVVLVVEDNADVRAYLRSHLAPLYRVEEAVDGVDGLEKARANHPALVISDVMMPRMDGYELCRALKTDEALNHIPVVLLTAKADEESKVEGLETGADDYIYKPFSAAELLVRAENLIQIRRLLRQRFSGEVVLSPSQIAIPSAEAAFLERVREVVEAHMADSNFGVDWLAAEVGVSTRKLQRTLKASLNLSPSGYIRTMRLERAAQLLAGGVGNVSEVAYAVGFRDLKHFSKLFRQIFGVLPSQYTTEGA